MALAIHSATNEIVVDRCREGGLSGLPNPSISCIQKVPVDSGSLPAAWQGTRTRRQDKSVEENKKRKVVLVVGCRGEGV